MTQPRSRRSSAKIVLIVLAVLVVLCCCGGGAGAFLFFNNATKAAGQATSAFLTEVESGKVDAAYDRLCDATKSRYERQMFADAISRRTPAAHDVHWGGGYDNDGGHETATITADITWVGGGKDARTFQLVKESDTWKVCGNPF